VHGVTAGKTTHAALPRHADGGQCNVVGNVLSCPHCRRLCNPPLCSGRRGRPGKCGRVILRQLVIGRLLLAAIVRRLLVTSKGNDAYRLHARRTAIHTVAVTMQHRLGYFQSLNKIRIVADELRMFKKPNLTSLDRIV